VQSWLECAVIIVHGGVYCGSRIVSRYEMGSPEKIYSVTGRVSLTLGHGRPTFYGTGPHPLLWAGSRARRETIIVTGIPNRLEYCAIFIVYTQFTNVAAAA